MTNYDRDKTLQLWGYFAIGVNKSLLIAIVFIRLQLGKSSRTVLYRMWFH